MAEKTDEATRRAAIAELARRELARREAARQQASALEAQQEAPQGVPQEADPFRERMLSQLRESPAARFGTPSEAQDQMRRQFGLAARAAAGGVADIFSPFVDLPVRGLNAAARGISGDEAPQIPGLSQSVDQSLDLVGVPRPEGRYEEMGQTAGRITAGMAAGGPLTRAVMARLGLAAPPTNAPRANRQQVLQDAQREGLVVPPASASRGVVAGTLEGAAGKLKTAQLASQRNQPVINRLASRALGLGDDVEITPEVLSSVRSEAGRAYGAIRNAGTIQTDNQFRTAITSAVQRFRDAAQSFPRLAKSEIIDIADDINKQTFDAGSGVDAIALLRDKADAAFRAGDRSLGSSYRALSNAIEGQIERHLASGGQDARGILNAFRAARSTIAKTYTIENALKGSNVDAAALARALNRGAPLSDELRLIGQFAQEFPKASRMLNESIPSYSPLDFWSTAASLGAAVGTQSPAMAIPAAYSMGRPALRGALLTPAAQRLLARPPSGVPNALIGPALGGLPSAVNALVDVPLDAEPAVR